jgi:hypothetical protein
MSTNDQQEQNMKFRKHEVVMQEYLEGGWVHYRTRRFFTAWGAHRAFARAVARMEEGLS